MLVEIEVRNTKRFAPSYSIEVEDRIAERRTDKRCYFLKVSAGARQTAAYRRTPPVRGIERYLALRVATRFPFGLFEKWREVDLVEEQTVYPSPARSRDSSATVPTMGDAAPRDGRGRGEVDGVRELGSDEPARDIDWKKSASRGRLVARERRREGARRLRLVVANRIPAGANDGVPPMVPADVSRRIEDDVRRVAYSALDALREGTAVEIHAEDDGHGRPGSLTATPGSTAPDRVLSYLARLPPVPSAEP
jgi:uncharacterized protein (DUF58 family)